MTAILMRPQTIPSRFSLAEEAEPAPRTRTRPAAGMMDKLAAALGRLQRQLSTPPARRPDSSAAAW